MSKLCPACVATRIPCPNCAPKTATAFDRLPTWPGAHQMTAGDDDEEAEDEGEADEEEANEDEEDEATKSGKGGKKKSAAADDDDEGGPKKRGKDAPAKSGMGIGMILGIVFVALTCCICLPGVGVVVVFFSGVRGAAANVAAKNNMRQIALACENYNMTFQKLPSPRSEKADLSWRVDILPFVEQNVLFMQINQETAWDKGPNAAFKNEMPNIYDIPGGTPSKSETKFQYFTGPNTLFPDAKATRRVGPADIPAGTSNTFLFAEAATPVPWMKPADMAIAPNGPIPLPQGRFMAAMCDGTIHVIDRGKINDDTLRMMMNPKNEKPLPPNLFSD